MHDETNRFVSIFLNVPKLFIVPSAFENPIDWGRHHFTSLYYDCEIWYHIQRIEYKLVVFGSKVLKKVVGSKKNAVSREWRLLCDEELHDL